MTSSEIAMPGEVKADPAALMASLQLLPSPTPNLEIKYTKVKPSCGRFLEASSGSLQRPGPGGRLSSPTPPGETAMRASEVAPRLGERLGGTGPKPEGSAGIAAAADGGDDLGTAWVRSWGPPDVPGQNEA